jgi:type I restriction enzyme S subunit
MHKSIKVSEFLHRVKEPVELQPEQEYSLVTIKVHHRGVTLRNKTKGKLIGSKMHRISKGQFILSGIDARHGAFGIVPDELDGAIVTNDFWYFDIDETKVKRDFFYWLTNTPIFLNACIKSSQGVTQRVRLQAKLFFDFEFRFPPLEEQENFLKKIQHADQYLSLLRVELNNQEKYISQLKQAILQEAIAGQLTAEWRTQNPMQKGNPDTDAAALLAKIKAEKQQAIADGKLKKEKPLAEIAIDEILFSLPDNWVWCRLGSITTLITDGKHGDCQNEANWLFWV